MNLNKIILLLMMSFTINGMFAQGKARERIKTLKVAYITEQLNLSSEEAQNFWPVYNNHEEKMSVIRKSERENFKPNSTDLSSISNEQAKKIVSSLMSIRAKKLEEEQTYIKNLQGVISPVKIVRLIKAEESFKKRLLQQYRKRRNSGE